MPSYQSNSPRSPMKSLTAAENIPVLSSSPPKKSKQLGIEMFTKKRSLDIEEIPNPKKRPKVTENDSIVNKEVKAKCHQCHQYVHLIRAFRCTELKRTKGRYDFYCCGAVYCMRCIDNRYDISKYLAYKDLARVQLPPGIPLPPGAEYPWTCPACAKECDCSSCRKKEGLEPLGYTSLQIFLIEVRLNAMEGNKTNRRPRRRKKSKVLRVQESKPSSNKLNGMRIMPLSMKRTSALISLRSLSNINPQQRRNQGDRPSKSWNHLHFILSVRQ